jgi:N-methylhydantoinase A/oxoprolinase/acetone carboxylase beta subunit
MAGMPDAGTIAIDVGGPFTDMMLADAGTSATWVAKTPSTLGDRGGRDEREMTTRHSVPRPVRANVQRHSE